MRTIYCSFAFAAIHAIGNGACGQESSHESHDDHDNEEAIFGQTSVYNMESGDNNLIILPGEGEINFAEDDSLAFMVVPAGTADQEGLEAAKEAAMPCEQYLRKICTQLNLSNQKVKVGALAVRTKLYMVLKGFPSVIT